MAAGAWARETFLSLEFDSRQPSKVEIHPLEVSIRVETGSRTFTPFPTCAWRSRLGALEECVVVFIDCHEFPALLAKLVWALKVAVVHVLDHQLNDEIFPLPHSVAWYTGPETLAWYSPAMADWDLWKQKFASREISKTNWTTVRTVGGEFHRCFGVEVAGWDSGFLNLLLKDGSKVAVPWDRIASISYD